MLSERRDKPATRRFFRREISNSTVPEHIFIDKNGANLAGLEAVNVILNFTGSGEITNILQVKCLKNILQ